MRAGYRLCISPVRILKNLGEKYGECWVVVFQLIAGIDVIMLVIVCAIGIKPRLRAFSPVLRFVCNGIGVFPQFLFRPPRRTLPEGDHQNWGQPCSIPSGGSHARIRGPEYSQSNKGRLHN